MRHVPNVDFTSFNYVVGMPFSGLGSYEYHGFAQFIYNGPSPEVEKLAVAVAAQGAILPISPPAENSSWALDFYGPSLSCRTMEDGTRAQVESNIVNFLENSGDCLFRASTYLCWNPNILDEEPPGYPRNTTPLPYPSMDRFQDPESVRGDNKGPFTPIYIASLPSLVTDPCGIQHNASLQPTANASFFQCELQNASYHVDFAYKSGIQNIVVEVEHLEAIANVFRVFGPPIHPSDYPINDCDRLEEYEPLKDSPCVFDTSLLRRLSYTGISDAFHRLVVGSVAINIWDGFQKVDTSIFATSLIHTPELQYILQAVKGLRGETTLQDQYLLNKTSQAAPLVKTEEVSPRSSLPRVMEELFTNITISLMSLDLLQ